MDKKQMKVAGIVCLILCAICIFVAIERYNANAGKVQAMNSFTQQAPFGMVMGGIQMKPGTPPATKYAAFFAALSGIGGVTLLVLSGKKS